MTEGRNGGIQGLLRELKKEEEKLLTCVHCGFCLPACPTYTRLGDEADSPRGRLHFMRAIAEGRIRPDSPVATRHLDRCLGCRGCESVCPSGVEYGRLLEGARDAVAAASGRDRLTRLLSWAMASGGPRRLALAGARVLRSTGLPALLAQRLPGRGRLWQVRVGLAMLAATTPPSALGRKSSLEARGRQAPTAKSRKLMGRGVRVGLLIGCVQEGLLGRVNRATERVLEANGFEVVPVEGQECCGAIHAHTGDLQGARALARRNVRAFQALKLNTVVVNAAGCGATLKDYGHLLEDDPELGLEAAEFARKVVDISEVLQRAGLRTGAPVPLQITYDAPCHLLHAQRITHEPPGLLDAIPGVERRPLRKEEECCGGAGIYGITQPEMGGRIGSDKVDAILETGARVVATGNPGCMMQIGGELRMRGSEVDVVHPVEILDESYRRGGFYW